MLLGVDVGGTFTDFILLDAGGRLRVHKAPTTPDDQSRAIADGVQHLGVAPDAPVVHGTTVATNALLEHRGARAALVTTAGFRDVLVIGRQNRPHLYRFSQTRPPALIPADLRLGVPERLAADGRVLTPLDEAAVRDVAERLAEAGAESIAVVLLHSYRNPDHEQRVAAILREYLPEVPLSISSDLLPEYREYERTATTVVNAYVQPLVATYLARLEERLAGRPLRIMQSNGGTIGARQAADEAARLVLSGPAGGVVGAVALARQAMDTDAPRLLTFDMGGTSTDVALCPGTIPRTAEGTIAGLPIRLPTTDIHTVGAGGGSLARVDAGGVLHVGPASAGAVPGPACYGRGGTEPTVTDANLVLGRLDPAGFLGGASASVQLDAEAARVAVQKVAEPLGLSVEVAALGILRVANATMERALRRVSVERGHDPRTYALVPFGGAGPLHACALAEALGIRRILLPPYPGVLSALGLLLADVVSDRAQAVLRPAHALRDDPAPLARIVGALVEEIRAVLAEEVGSAGAQLDLELDLRYAGQSYELTVPCRRPVDAGAVAEAVEAFHAAHEQRYSYAMPDEPVEVVAARVRGRLPGADFALPRLPAFTESVETARLGAKPVWFADDAPLRTPSYDRRRLGPGHAFQGPAIVLQYDTTTVVAPGWVARVDAWANLWLERAEGEAS